MVAFNVYMQVYDSLDLLVLFPVQQKRNYNHMRKSCTVYFYDVILMHKSVVLGLFLRKLHEPWQVFDRKTSEVYF